MPVAKPELPPCFKRKIHFDNCMAEPVVSIAMLRERRRIRRECQVFLLGPAGGGTIGGGAPVAMTG